MKDLAQTVNNTWKQLLDKVIKEEGDNLHELSIHLQLYDGTTIEQSWLDREERLSEKL